MGGMKISDLDFLRLLPVFMRDDQAVKALSQSINDLIGEPGKRLATLRTWDKIDELTEAECDELAWELDIDWYDSIGMGLEEKRETIKSAQQIKRKRGTKWAVERLLSAYFGEGYVLEWYETGGLPYTFAASTTNPNIDAENYVKFMEAVNAAKNERSRMTGFFFFWPMGPDPGVEYVPRSSSYLYPLRKCGTYSRTTPVGFSMKSGGVENEPEEKTYLYTFPECGVNGDKATLGAAIVGTAIVGKAIVRS